MTYDANALQWTSAQLLADVRRKASLPVTSTDFTDAVLLRECTDVLWSFAGWAVSQAGEGRLTSSLDRTLSSGLYTSTYRTASEVDLPSLAVGDTIDSVSFIDATGNNQSRLMRLEASNESDYDTPSSTGTPSAYALVGGRLRLYPKPTNGGTLRVYYQRRHPELVVDSLTTVATLTNAAANSTQTNLTVSSAFAAAAVGSEVDITQIFAPYRTILAAANVTANSGTTITINVPFSPTFDGMTLTGYRVTLAGQSPYVQLPLEFRAAVTEKVAANVMRILGDITGMQASEQAALTELGRVNQMLSPRVKRDKPKAINPYSHMRLAMRRWGWPR